MLPKEDIKQLILHPDSNVRRLATDYFSRSFSDDFTVMPLVIEAVERYGRTESVHLVSQGEDLPQTEETVQWCVDELRRELGEDETDLDDYWFVLSRVLGNADPSLTLSKEAEILELPHFLPELGTALTERNHLLTEDSSSLWSKLEEFCERERFKRYLSEMDLPHAFRIVEALGRDNGLIPQVLAMLDEEIDEPADSPRLLMQGFVIRLAGELRLRKAIPALIQLLKVDDEWFDAECERALIRIGGDDVVEALSKEFPAAEWHFKLHGTGVLENEHTHLCLQKCLELFGEERVEAIKVELGRAALSQFSTAAIEPIRQFILRSKLNPEILDLRETLVTLSTALGANFPELEEWRKSEDENRALRRVLFAEKFGVSQSSAADWADEPEDDSDVLEFDDFADPTPAPTTFVHHDAKTGRNDPCPCGSGKKYKKCCLNKTNGDSLRN